MQTHTHACTFMHIHILVLTVIVQEKMHTKHTHTHLNKHCHVHSLIHTLIHTHTDTHPQSYYLCRSRHGVLEIKAGQGVIWYLRLLHAHALDSHQRHVPHFSSALASSGWYHTSDIAAFFSLLWLCVCVCVCAFAHTWICVCLCASP